MTPGLDGNLGRLTESLLDAFAQRPNEWLTLREIRDATGATQTRAQRRLLRLSLAGAVHRTTLRGNLYRPTEAFLTGVVDLRGRAAVYVSKDVCSEGEAAYARVLGDALAEVRTRKGVGRQHITHRISLGWDVVGHYETGRAVPGPRGLVELCRALDTPPSVLLSLAHLRFLRMRGFTPCLRFYDWQERLATAAALAFADLPEELSPFGAGYCEHTACADRGSRA